MSENQAGLKYDVITIGETMAVFAPRQAGLLRYVKDYELRAAGAESNVAIGVCKLGHKAGWISKLGDDELGEAVLYSIRAEGVDVSAVTMTEELRTGLMVKQIYNNSETSVFYYRENSAASNMSVNDIDFELLKQASVIHLTGITAVLSKKCEALVLAISEFANANHIIFSFDPNIRRKLWRGRDYVPLMKTLCERADILLTGVEEAEVIYGKADARRLAEKIFTSGRVSYLALKDGERGAYAAGRDAFHHIPAYPCHCIDPIGAGDAFDAAFLCGFLEGCSIEECGRMGAIAGAFATETNGDTEGYPTRKQIEEAVKGTSKQIYR